MDSQRYVSGDEALKAVQSCSRVFIHGGAATPHFLLRKLVERADELHDVELVCISLQGAAPFADARYKGIFRLNSLFVSANVRDLVNTGLGDYIPVFLSQFPASPLPGYHRQNHTISGYRKQRQIRSYRDASS